MRIESALGFTAMMEVPVPVRFATEVAAVGQHPVRVGAREGRHAAAALLGHHVQRPAAARMGVVIAIRAQRPQLQIHGLDRFTKMQRHVRGVAPLRHPHALLEQGVTTGVGPEWRSDVVRIGLQPLEAARRDRAVGKLVAAELEGFAAITREDFELRHHDDALHRWPERCHEEPVVAPRVGLGQRAAGKAAERVRHQPFAGECACRVGDVTPRKRHGRIPGCSRSIRYSALRAHR